MIAAWRELLPEGGSPISGRTARSSAKRCAREEWRILAMQRPGRWACAQAREDVEEAYADSFATAVRRSTNGDWQTLPADEIFPSLRRSCASRKMQVAGATHRRLTAPQLWQMLLRTLPRHFRGPERMPTSLDVVWKGKAAILARERRRYLCAGATRTMCKRASMDVCLLTVLGVERRGVVGDSRRNVSDCEMVRTCGHHSFPKKEALF